MALYSVEVRRRLGRTPLVDGWLEGVWFMDAGRTWDPREPTRLADFDYAFGPALRLHMKSPLYLDWRGELNVNGALAVYAGARRGF